jgi:hypothetical protein
MFPGFGSVTRSIRLIWRLRFWGILFDGTEPLFSQYD